MQSGGLVYGGTTQVLPSGNIKRVSADGKTTVIRASRPGRKGLASWGGNQSGRVTTMPIRKGRRHAAPATSLRHGGSVRGRGK